jgi:hypothetical protein
MMSIEVEEDRDSQASEPDEAEPISMERRCQVAGCRAIFIAPAIEELRCPSCRRRRRQAAPAQQSLYGCAAARCIGVGK